MLKSERHYLSAELFVTGSSLDSDRFFVDIDTLWGFAVTSDYDWLCK